MIKQKRRQQRTSIPPLLTILIAMAVRWCDIARIARWRRSRAFIKATKCCHRATTCSVSPRRLPGQQKTKQTLLSISMAVVVRRYYTARIAQWGKSMAFLKATNRRHRASTHSDIIKGTWQCHEFAIFEEFHAPEMVRLSWMAKKFTRGMTAYQWKAKDLVNAQEY